MKLTEQIIDELKYKIFCNFHPSVDFCCPEFINIYGLETTKIGSETKIGSFVEVQNNVVIGSRCKVSSHSFISSGVEIGNGVFVGHSVTFINDKYPAAVNDQGKLKGKEDWTLLKIIVEDNVSIGSNATIMGGIKIGKGAQIGCGSVILKSVLENDIVAGNPAESIKNRQIPKRIKEYVSKRIAIALEKIGY